MTDTAAPTEDVCTPFTNMDYGDWIAYGMEQGWAGPAVCATHDGVPSSEAEELEWEDGDPCQHIIRLYEDLDVKAAVEANHAPSMWRQ